MKTYGMRAIQHAKVANDRLRAQLSRLFGARPRQKFRVRSPRRIAHYELRKEIGAGAMGVVYRAWDRRWHRWVAIKILAHADQESRQRFHREARCAAALHHPNIVVVHELILQEALDATVMEYVPGRTLDRVIPRRGLPLRTFLDYAQQIAGSVAAVHDAGMIHRDLKPANVMVRNGVVVLLDFGMVKIVNRKRISPVLGCAEQLPVTVAGTIIGTAGYMSPEQVRGRPADQRSDIFGLGAIFYEMLAGHSAFGRRAPIETMSAILNQAPRPLSRRVPRVIDQIVRRCLAKKPTRRYRTVKELMLDLMHAAKVMRPRGQAAASNSHAMR